MDYRKRFLELCMIDRLVEYKEPASASELISMGKHYLDLWRKIESAGTQQGTRVWDLISMMLAQYLQPIAQQKHGNGSEAAIKSLLEESWQDKDHAKWEKQKLVAKQALSSLGLNQEQETAIGEVIERYPQIMTSFVAALVGRLQMVAVENTAEITSVLLAMYEEASNANQN